MKASVALCTYNGDAFIKEQINSIVNQTVKVSEIVISDDGSSDDTLKILKGFEKDNPELDFVFLPYEKNLGSIKNFERAISHCSHEIIFLSDQDDIWHEEKVSKSMTLFKDNPNIEGLFTNAHLIDESSKIIPNKTLWDSIGFFHHLLSADISILNLLVYQNIATGATMAIRKSVVKFLKPFPLVKCPMNNEDVMHHDYWIALRLALRNSLSIINENLISYRIHQNQQVGIANDFNRKDLEKRFKLFWGNTPVKDLDFKSLKKLLKRYARVYNSYIRINDVKELQDVFSIYEKELVTNYKEVYKVFISKYPLISKIIIKKYKKRGDYIDLLKNQIS